jgi:hypothetical protein
MQDWVGGKYKIPEIKSSHDGSDLYIRDRKTQLLITNILSNLYRIIDIDYNTPTN